MRLSQNKPTQIMDDAFVNKILELRDTLFVEAEELVASWTMSFTQTNLTVVMRDCYNQANSDGKAIQIDTNARTQLKFQVAWNKSTFTGIHNIQVIEVGTANILCSLNNLVSGRNITALTPIPAFAQNSVKFYKLQAQSTVATDDPILEAAYIYMK